MRKIVHLDVMHVQNKEEQLKLQQLPENIVNEIILFILYNTLHY